VTQIEPQNTFLTGGGRLGALIRAKDWAATPLGPVETWPQSLRTSVSTCLNCTFPILIWWGPDLIKIYNDAYAEMIAAKHPWALGAAGRDVWPEIWDTIGPMLGRVMDKGEAYPADDLRLDLHRNGYAEECYFSFSYSPIRDETGDVAGVFCPVVETTARVFAERRAAFLLELENRLRAASTSRIALEVACEAIGNALGGVICTFNEFEADDRHVEVTSEWRVPGTPSALGRHDLADWGEDRLPDLLSGAPERVEDILADPHTAGTPAVAAYAALGCRASLNVPYVRDGRVRAMLAIGVAEPRRWADHEVALALETIDRTWSAVERARAQAALYKAEGDYRALFMGTPTPFILLSPDPACFTILDVNEAYLAATMTTRERLIGRDLFDAFPGNPADTNGGGVNILRASLEHALSSKQTDAPLRLKYDVAGLDGRFEERFWNPVNTPLLDVDGEVIALLHHATDVTDAVRAEAALAESEKRLRLAADNAEIGFWDVDLINDVLIWPPRTKALFGISPEVPVSMADFYAGLHSEELEATSLAFANAADPARRDLYDVEYRTVGKEDGLVRWVSAKGRGVFDGDGPAARCLRVAGTAVEITARKQAELAVRHLNETLQQRVAETAADLDRVWRNAGDIFVVIDGENGVFRRVNPATTAILGWSEDELLGRPVFDFMHPDDIERSFAAMERTRSDALPAFENRYRTKDGRFRTVSWVAAPEGALIYCYGRDVTAGKEREAELEAAREALRQSQKMEAMGQLTGGVAHDFNNLLTPIVGSLDMLRRKGLGGEREQRLIAGAVQSAERARVLVQRLLAFARRQPLQSSAVDIARLVTGMGDLVSSTTGPQIRVVVDARGDLPPAKADPNQVEMALLNLAVNARDAMPEGGTLRITASEESIGSAHPSRLRPGPYIRLSVADTGTGMDEATVARAIEPFFSTKGVGKGTGLGLSMVHGLASQLGGALTIQSRPGLGTNVELWLPLSESELETPESAVIAPDRPAARGAVLLVDDEALVRMSTADMLTELGYDVIEAATAEEAMRLVDRGQRFDLLVTDHLMPGMSGVDLAHAISASKPGVPVLLVSGYAENEGIDPRLPRLTKPFRKDELEASLARLPVTAPVTY
jgi:PAS domain S-box-containing protein